eukprot:3651124-Prymnesium_polylepis.1
MAYLTAPASASRRSAGESSGMADDPKPPGRPSALGKRVREDCLSPDASLRYLEVVSLEAGGR